MHNAWVGILLLEFLISVLCWFRWEIMNLIRRRGTLFFEICSCDGEEFKGLEGLVATRWTHMIHYHPPIMIIHSHHGTLLYFNPLMMMIISWDIQLPSVVYQLSWCMIFINSTLYTNICIIFQIKREFKLKLDEKLIQVDHDLSVFSFLLTFSHNLT